MSTAGRPTAGATRLCPHCGAVILRSTAVCPSCRKHLRYAPTAEVLPTFVPLRVAGAIRHPGAGEAWEYAVTVTITNDQGKEIARQIVGVGALEPGEERTFTVAVEVFTPAGVAEERSS
ncbi:MAG TPA: FxLYD domain-containing protein [Gemmatimonadaceae bacterium]|nr:FxLYD domain-containing protein [Gemmatimonadaceae bacterium]